jgi:mannose-1-phosphate guanylyltransferase
MTKIKAVIMAGGSGTRLWPLSRATHPKQFLALNGEATMLQDTVKRLSDLNIASFFTLCNEEHRFFVAEQMRQIGKLGSIILEPEGRNTAPALALAALLSDEDDLLLVLAADHVIQNNELFVETVKEAVPLADSDKFVTFGVVPGTPHTGYGYIKKGQKVGVGFDVVKFVEKPSIELAQEYVNSGDYLWNSGMFLVKASLFLNELSKFNPDIYEACQMAVAEVKEDQDFIRINNEKFLECPSKSIDYSIMEKTNTAVVVPMDVGWSDIGSWSSLWDLSKKDCSGNATYGDVVLHSSRNSYIRTDGMLVAAIGVDNLVLVATKDAIMIAHKDSVQNVKIITQALEADARVEWALNREVYRPWGKFDTIDRGERYQVKRITVKPGAKLSVQMHHHRAEHWVVVSGTARVTNGEKVFLLSENESTYIPIGVVHALENPGKVELELIEVQSGRYLGEDDIVRFDDRYGR